MPVWQNTRCFYALLYGGYGFIDVDYTFENIKKSIDNELPLNLSFGVKGTRISHNVNIIGYTDDGKIIVNDPYGDFNRQETRFGQASMNGEKAVYDMSEFIEFPTLYTFIAIK